MTQKETKSRTKQRLAAIEAKFANVYETVSIGKRTCFQIPDGRLIALACLGAYRALVIEYAKDYEEAGSNQFEDGDLFFVEDLDEETMFQNMLQEIG